MGKCILALDQGTTGSRAILFDREQNITNQREKLLTGWHGAAGRSRDWAG